MYLEKPDILFKDCIIKPLDNQEGLIIAVRHNKCHSEIQVRYFVHGQAVFQWFFDFDIELKKENIRGIGFLNG